MNRGVITTLRDVVPLRPLTQNEAYRIAELQANRLLKLSGVEGPAVPNTVITDIPKIHVRYMKPWPVSGCTDWTGSTWNIAIKADEPHGRQRFSLAHEFKHILDNKFIEFMYPDSFGWKSQERAEAVCHYFAGCLLVPKKWLRQAWTSGIQNPIALAKLFDVTPAAIQVRLNQTGLNQPTPRHDWTRPSTSTRYYRIGHLVSVREPATF